jgi:hypothetical protein
MFWKFVIFCIKLVSEWPILLPGNDQNAGFYTIYPRASGGLQRTPSRRAPRKSPKRTGLNHLGEAFRQPDILNEHVKLKIKVGKVYYKIP